MNRSIDLALAIAWALATTVIVLLAPFAEPARIALGLVFVLFLPGYVLVAALYPRRDDLDPVERLALSLGLSIAVVPLIGLGLNYSPWGIRLNPILAFLTLFIVLAAGVATYRRLMLPSDEAMRIPVNLALPKWPRVRMVDRLLGLLLVLALAGLGVGAYFLATSSTGSEEFTEFYVLGPGGKAEGYPREVDVGDIFTLILGVVNHEGEEASYRLQATIAGRLAASMDGPQLANKERWESPLALIATQPGSDQKVEFVLYKGKDDVPYRTLHLWLDIDGSPPETIVTETPSAEQATPSAPSALSEALPPGPLPLPTTPSSPTYVVQSGDTLIDIGTVFGLHFTEIAAANDTADPDLIYAGQTLAIPGRGP
jgi:uncharacterized membrane protein